MSDVRTRFETDLHLLGRSYFPLDLRSPDSPLHWRELLVFSAAAYLTLNEALTDTAHITKDVKMGFLVRTRADADTVEARSPAATASIPAVAYCHGTPLRNEIVARDSERLEEATSYVAAAIERHHGRNDVVGRISAHVVSVTAP